MKIVPCLCFSGTRIVSVMSVKVAKSVVRTCPLAVETGTPEIWSDPYGMFLAAVAAEPVYKLLGKEGLGMDKMSPAGEAILHTVCFPMHKSGHGMAGSDWGVFIRFVDMHLKPWPGSPEGAGCL